MISQDRIRIDFPGYENLTDEAAEAILQQVSQALTIDAEYIVFAVHPDPEYPIVMVRNLNTNVPSMVQINLNRHERKTDF